MPGIPLPGSGERSHTLGWAEMLKTIIYPFPYSLISAVVKDMSFEWQLIGDKGQQGREVLLPTFPIQNVYAWWK